MSRLSDNGIVGVYSRTCSSVNKNPFVKLAASARPATCIQSERTKHSNDKNSETGAVFAAADATGKAIHVVYRLMEEWVNVEGGTGCDTEIDSDKPYCANYSWRSELAASCIDFATSSSASCKIQPTLSHLSSKPSKPHPTSILYISQTFHNYRVLV